MDLARLAHGPARRGSGSTTGRLALALATPLALLGCSTPLVPAPVTTHAAAWEELDQELRELARRHELPGLSVTVLSGSEVVFARGYGWADREGRVPVGPGTMFPSGSFEKEFTAPARAGGRRRTASRAPDSRPHPCSRGDRARRLRGVRGGRFARGS